VGWTIAALIVHFAEEDAMSAAAATRMKNAATANIAVIGDEETVTGFLLAGVGGVDAKKESTYLIVDAKTKHSDIETAFQKFSTSSDIGILLISQPVRRVVETFARFSSHSSPSLSRRRLPSRFVIWCPSTRA
jgi:ATP synthase F subunit